MVQGFYELLGVEPGATASELRAAYQRRLGDLVRRLRQARKQGADTSLLEAQERDLRTAIDVLSDPSRRRRYDAFRSALVRGLPDDAGALWEQARTALGCDAHQTSANGQVTLEPVYCLGLCAASPALRLDDQVHARVDGRMLGGLLRQAEGQ